MDVGYTIGVICTTNVIHIIHVIRIIDVVCLTMSCYCYYIISDHAAISTEIASAYDLEVSFDLTSGQKKDSPVSLKYFLL
jgi:hypothetical protein